MFFLLGDVTVEALMNLFASLDGVEGVEGISCCIKDMGDFIHVSGEMEFLEVIFFSTRSTVAVRLNWSWNIQNLMAYVHSAFAIQWVR